MRRLQVVMGMALAAGMAPAAVAQEAGGLAAFEACGRIVEDARRHACLDEALRAAGMLEEPGPGETPAAVEGIGAPAPAPAIAAAPPAPGPMPRLAPAPHSAAAAPPSAPAPGGERQPVRTSIAAARLIGSHTLEITTAAAGRWVSTERQDFRRAPRAGAAFEIIPAALGGHRCRLERSTIFPCRRLD